MDRVRFVEHQGRPGGGVPRRARAIFRGARSGAVEQQQDGGEGEQQQHQASTAWASRDPPGKASHAGKLAADRAANDPLLSGDCMFDANYFRTVLPRDVEAAGGSPVVELLLVGGHAHRVRSVVDVTDGLITFDAYQVRGELTNHRPRYGQTSVESSETFRVVVSCESIVAVVLDPAPAQTTRTRPGFA
jgi:hypothetical protein